LLAIREELRQKYTPTAPAIVVPAPVTCTDYYIHALLDIMSYRYESAERSLKDLVALEEQHAAAHFLLGVVSYHLGDNNEALARFQVAKALMPQDYRPALERGMILYEMSRYEDALDEFDIAIQRGPTIADIYIERARLMQYREQYSEAESDLHEAERLGANPYEVTGQFIRLFRASGEQEKVQQLEAKLTAMRPTTDRELIIRGSTIYDRAMSENISDFRKAVELNPRNILAWRSIAYVQQSSPETLPEAIAAMRQVIKMSPRNTTMKCHLAKLLAMNDQFEEAITLLRGLKLTLAAEHITATSVYALAAKDDPNMVDLALGHLRKAIQKGYSNLSAIETTEDFLNIRDDDRFNEILLDAAKWLR
jgi:tetratricopeptide (TPR) repeat protein